MPEATAPPPRETNLKETIESILVAFILAFMFRAFIVEAFVIPTGSMAPTLLGAHLRYTCEDCGYPFTVNYQKPSSGPDDADVSPPSSSRLLVRTQTRDGKFVDQLVNKTYRIHCPNCGFRVPRENPGNPDNAATNPPVSYGDRILVLKYLYLLREPHRWDVVVFKSPDQPEKYDYVQNYIKRLVGRPGESVMVLDGDIFVSRKGKDSQPGDFVVQTKPRHAQEALWRVVYDNDYFPRGLRRTLFDAKRQPFGADPIFTFPWVGKGDGWDLSGKHVLKFQNMTGGSELAFDAEANPFLGTASPSPALTDWLAYDFSVNQNQQGGNPDTFENGGYLPEHNVSDVKLAMYYTRSAGDGPLRVSLTVRPQTPVRRQFVTEVGSKDVKLISVDEKGQSVVLQGAVHSADLAQPTKVEVIHADYQLTVRINGRDVLQTTPAQYAPDVAFLLNSFNASVRLPKPEISISAEKQTCEIRHLGLWRDVYYTNRDKAFGPDITRRSNPTPLRWASPDNFPSRIIHLGPDEYFCCGDNSLISGDGRYWGTPINLPVEQLEADSGRVPGRFLLGKAFFVYWPSGFRPGSSEGMPSIIPNFGEMRFIH